MKKIIISVVILIVAIVLIMFFTKTCNVDTCRTINTVADLTPSDKTQITKAIISGEKIMRSGDVVAIRNMINEANPKNSMLNLPDSALKSLSDIVAKTEIVTEEQIIKSSQWLFKDNVVSIIVDKGKNVSSLFRAVYKGGKWYHY